LVEQSIPKVSGDAVPRPGTKSHLSRYTAIPFQADNVFVNAIEMSSRFGKRPNDFLILLWTKRFQDVLAEDLKALPAKLVTVPAKGGKFKNFTVARKLRNGGTWHMDPLRFGAGMRPLVFAAICHLV